MLRERRGTCSTKHLFLARTLAERFPKTEPLIVHRVYRLDHIRALELFDMRVANVVPEYGLVDIHRYLTIVVEGRRINVDATFPGPPWDGRSSLPLACGPGTITQPVKIPTPRSARLRPSTATRRFVSRSSRRWRP